MACGIRRVRIPGGSERPLHGVGAWLRTAGVARAGPQRRYREHVGAEKEVGIMCRPKFSRHAAVLGLAMLIAAGVAVPARAQHTPDPYNIVGEGNLGYQDYMYSTYPNGAGFTPNQGALQGRTGLRQANQFQSYLNELDGIGSGSDSLYGSGRSRGGFGEPYYRAHHQYDEAFNRIYTPNEAADRTYYKDQQARTDKYLEYLRESDLKKRTQLYREYNRQSLQSARDYGAGSSRASTRTSNSAPADTIPPRSTSPRAGTARHGVPRLIRQLDHRACGRTRRAACGAGGHPQACRRLPGAILDRADLMDRANRSSGSASVPSRTAPAPAPR